jgi:hypothetical protein
MRLGDISKIQKCHSFRNTGKEVKVFFPPTSCYFHAFSNPFLGDGLEPSSLLLSQPLMMMMMMMMMMSVEQFVECLAAETEVFGENLPHCCFGHQKSYMTRPGHEPWPPRWKVGDFSVLCFLF